MLPAPPPTMALPPPPPTTMALPPPLPSSGSAAAEAASLTSPCDLVLAASK